MYYNYRKAVTDDAENYLLIDREQGSLDLQDDDFDHVLEIYTEYMNRSDDVTGGDSGSYKPTRYEDDKKAEWVAGNQWLLDAVLSESSDDERAIAKEDAVYADVLIRKFLLPQVLPDVLRSMLDEVKELGKYFIEEIRFHKDEPFSFITIEGLQRKLVQLGYGDDNAKDLVHIYYCRKFNRHDKQYRIRIEDDGEFFEKMVRQKFWNAIAHDGYNNAFLVEFDEGEAVIEHILKHNYYIDDNPNPSMFDIPSDEVRLYNYYYTESEDDNTKYYLAVRK